MAVAVLALVFTREYAEVGCRPARGYSAFSHARDRRGVVAQVGDGSVPDVMPPRDEADLRQESRMLEVTVRDVTGQVSRCDEALLDLFRERESPHVPLAGVVVVNPSHAGFSRVCGT